MECNARIAHCLIYVVGFERNRVKIKKSAAEDAAARFVAKAEVESWQSALTHILKNFQNYLMTTRYPQAHAVLDYNGIKIFMQLGHFYLLDSL